MTKKRRSLFSDFVDRANYAEDDENFDDEIGLADAGADLSEIDVVALCGKPNAAKGSVLFASGAVTQRSFDGRALHATVRDGASLLPVVFDVNEESTVCSDVNHARVHNPTCEHIAAAMYAYINEPDSFFPHTMGEFINLLGSPDLRQQARATAPQVEALLRTLESAPPEVRAAFENLPLNATPKDLLQAAPQLQALAVTQGKTEFASLVADLAVDDLRAIAERRGWVLSASAKDKLIAQLTEALADAPLPAKFSPEEDQLLRLVNTLYGVDRDSDRTWLERVWKKRAGGDMRRLDLALRGLQSAGVLFPCTREGARLHYHWSPFVTALDLPLLPSKVKLYPADKVRQLQPAEPTLPILPLFDALIEFAEQTPLRLNVRARDPKISTLPYIGEWDYVPQEVEQIKSSYVPSGALTIPFLPFWADETLDTLETFAGGSRDLGNWIAGMLLTLGIVRATDDGNAHVDAEQVKAWRGQTPAEQQRALWHAWGNGAVAFGELRMATTRASLTAQRASLDESFTHRTLVEEMGAARQFVARLLAPLEPQTWYSWKAFAETTRDLRADFLHTHTHNNTWFLIAAKTRHRYDPGNTRHWDEAYRPVLATLFEGGLRWLGAVELAYDRQELVAFQVTALGAWLLSADQASPPPAAVRAEEPGVAAIHWLDDTTVRLRATTAAAKLMPLVRAFADPTREVLAFRVSNVSLARAFERGVTLPEIAEKFESVGAPLPPALRARMDTLAANYGRVHLYERLTVLELADDLALRELIAGTSLGKHIVHQFSPRLVVVRDEGVDELVNELVKKGYTPKVVVGDAESKT